MSFVSHLVSLSVCFEGGVEIFPTLIDCFGCFVTGTSLYYCMLALKKIADEQQNVNDRRGALQLLGLD
jgi:hypothetical protein